MHRSHRARKAKNRRRKANRRHGCRGPRLCVQARDGKLYVFMPPVEYLADYLDLVAAIEDTAAYLKMPVTIEGYTPPYDPRIAVLKVTPDPGVIEVNIQPAASLGRTRSQHHRALRHRATVPSGHREIHAGRAALRHRRRQSRRHRRAQSGGQPVSAPARSAAQHRSASGRIILRCPICFPGCSSAPPASIRAWTRPARIRSTNSKSPSIRSRTPGAPNVHAVAGGPHFPQSADRSDRQHASRRVLHRQALPARCCAPAARPGRAARFRNAAARAHEPDAATAGAGADRAFLANPAQARAGVAGEPPCMTASCCRISSSSIGKTSSKN